MTKGKSMSKYGMSIEKKYFEKPKNVQFSYLWKRKAKTKPL